MFEAFRHVRAILGGLVQGRVPVPGWARYLVGEELRLTEETLEYPNAFALLPDIYAAASIIAESIAATPLKFYARSGLDERELEPGENPIVDLFANANEVETGYDFIYTLVLNFLISGNGFFFLDYSGTVSGERPARGITDRTGKSRLIPDAIWTLAGHKTNVVLGENHRISHYLYMRDFEPVRIPKEQIVHIPDGSLAEDGMGMPRLTAARLTYETQRDAERYQREFFKRGGQGAGIYTSDLGLGREERKRLAASLALDVEGPENSWRAVVLPKGLKYERAALTQQEMQFLETGEMTTLKILRVFKLPPEVFAQRVGGLGASDKGLETALLYMIRFAMKPITDRIQARVNEQLFRNLFGMPDIVCRFDYSKEPAMQSLFLSMAEACQRVTGKNVMSVNEARERILGLPPDSDPESDKLSSPEPVAPEIASPKGGKMPGKMPMKGMPKPNAAVEEMLRDETVELIRKALDDEQERWAEYAHTRVIELLDRQEARIVDVVSATMKREEFARAIDLEALLRRLANPEDRALVRRLIASIMRTVGSAETARLGTQVAFLLTTAEAERFIRSQTTFMLTNVNATTEKMLMASLATGIRTGESESEMIARVREAFNDRRADAARIARTESHTSLNAGKMEAWRQAGITHKRWVTSRDEWVRGNPAGKDADSEFSHYHADGQVAELDKPFHVGDRRPGSGEKCMMPGDPHMSAGNRINCRCGIVPEVKVPMPHRDESIDEVLARE